MEREIPKVGEIWKNTKNTTEYQVIDFHIDADNDAAKDSLRVSYTPAHLVGVEGAPRFSRSLDEFMGVRYLGHGAWTFVYRFVKVEG